DKLSKPPNELVPLDGKVAGFIVVSNGPHFSCPPKRQRRLRVRGNFFSWRGRVFPCAGDPCASQGENIDRPLGIFRSWEVEKPCQRFPSWKPFLVKPSGHGFAVLRENVSHFDSPAVVGVPTVLDIRFVELLITLMGGDDFIGIYPGNRMEVTILRTG